MWYGNIPSSHYCYLSSCWSMLFWRTRTRTRTPGQINTNSTAFRCCPTMSNQLLRAILSLPSKIISRHSFKLFKFEINLLFQHSANLFPPSVSFCTKMSFLLWLNSFPAFISISLELNIFPAICGGCNQSLIKFGQLIKWWGSFPISLRAKLTEWEKAEIGYDGTPLTFRVNVTSSQRYQGTT